MDRRSFISKAGAGAALAGTTALSAPAIAQGKRTLTMVTSALRLCCFWQRRRLFRQRCHRDDRRSDHHRKKAAGELVGAFEVFDAVSSGQADIYHSADYYFGGQHPGLYYFTSVPFGATTEEFMAWYYHGGGHDLHDELGQIFNLKSFRLWKHEHAAGRLVQQEINSLTISAA